MIRSLFKYCINSFIFIALLLFFFQSLLYPGIVWNLFFYPIGLLSAFIFFFYKNSKSHLFLKAGSASLIFCILINLLWNFISHERLETPKNPIELKIMTYNLFFKNKYPNHSIKIIQDENPDILFVQELTPSWKSKLDRSINNLFPYSKTIALNGTSGIGAYSKFPIKNLEILKNNTGKPIAQIIGISIQGKMIRAINVHLASPAIAVENKEKFFSHYSRNYHQREQEIEQIFKIMENGNYQTQFLIGDLNTMRYEPLFKHIKKQWVDTYDKSNFGPGFNFPNSSRTKPFLMLDYILAKGNATCIDSKIIKGGSSDHLAVISTLKI